MCEYVWDNLFILHSKHVFSRGLKLVWSWSDTSIEASTVTWIHTIFSNLFPLYTLWRLIEDFFAKSCFKIVSKGGKGGTILYENFQQQETFNIHKCLHTCVPTKIHTYMKVILCQSSRANQNRPYPGTKRKYTWMQAPILKLSSWFGVILVQQYSTRNSRAQWHASCIMTHAHSHTHINTDFINILYDCTHKSACQTPARP